MGPYLLLGNDLRPCNEHKWLQAAQACNQVWSFVLWMKIITFCNHDCEQADNKSVSTIMSQHDGHDHNHCMVHVQEHRTKAECETRGLHSHMVSVDFRTARFKRDTVLYLQLRFCFPKSLLCISSSLSILDIVTIYDASNNITTTT